MKRLSLLAGTLLLASNTQALEVAGVNFSDKTQLAGSELTLNGGGLRSKAFFKVYAMGLYLPQKATSADAAVAAKGAKRIQIVTLRDLTAEQFTEAMFAGIAMNSAKSEVTALKPRMNDFANTLLSLRSIPKGVTMMVDFVPEKGTQLVFGGEAKGAPIPGEDFYKALLRIWLGQKPTQDDLKEALLGKVQ